MTELTFNTNEAAEKLQISIRRIQSLINSGKIKATKSGRDWIIPEKEIQRVEKETRQVGRPSKEKTKRSQEDQAFHDHPGKTYLEAVEILRTLCEEESLGNTYRAFAEAIWTHVRTSVMYPLKPRARSHVCLHRLLGKETCPDSIDHPCESPNFPGQDHLSEWVQDRKTIKIVSQPYHLSFETLKEMVQYCDEHGLRADISGESWHFPSKTIRVDFSLNQ